ncbi:MAG: phosphoesterase [Verrucomicrobia bacterium]|nr:phosphoesterase [Verrucomicrobiota bacterium]
MKKLTRFFRPQNSREAVLLFSVAAVFLCLWAFVAIASEAGEPEHLPLEERIIRSFRQQGDAGQLIGPAWVEHVTRDFSALGGVAVTLVLILLVGGYFIIDRKPMIAGFLLATMAGGTAISVALKQFFSRPRPTIVPLLDRVSDLSFPSGHSFNSAVVYLTLGIVLAHAVPRKRAKVYCIMAGFFLMALIGLSRVMLGVHYPTDVLGGWAAGTAWAAAASIALDFLQRKTNPEPARK